MKRLFLLVFHVMLAFGLCAQVHATLTTIGTAEYSGDDYNLIYDDVQSLVWLDYTKNAGDWQSQLDWADGLNFDGKVDLSSEYTTTIDWSRGWRLPITDESQADLSGGSGYEGPNDSGYHDYRFGYNMINSEMGHLFYESLGNEGLYTTDGDVRWGYGLTDTGDFDYLLEDAYWSGTQVSDDTQRAWRFDFASGLQGTSFQTDDSFYALAVHPGDVSTPIPEPTTMLLLGSGIVGFAGTRIRKRFKK